MVVRLLLHELGRHVQRRALDGREDERVVGHGPGEPEVAELHGAVGADEDVLRLHVAVDDAVRVEVVEGLDELPGDRLGVGGRGRAGGRLGLNGVGSPGSRALASRSAGGGRPAALRSQRERWPPVYRGAAPLCARMRC